jgi:hypothetical protein
VTRAGMLEGAQRRLWRLITGPEGVHRALADERAEDPLATLVRSDERLNAEERLDVYANAYFYRILDVLRDDTPILAEALSETGFHDLATSYLAVHPSEHPSLRFIGAKLEQFLRDDAAAAGIRERAPWAADLAAFEWAKGEVFDAEDAHPAARDDLADVPPEEFETLALALVPAVRLLALAWPVDTLRPSTADLAEQATRLTPATTALCIWRRDEKTLHRRIDETESAALTHACEGMSFGALCELAAARHSEAEAPALAAAWLARWLEDGLLQRFDA